MSVMTEFKESSKIQCTQLCNSLNNQSEGDNKGLEPKQDTDLSSNSLSPHVRRTPKL